MESPAPKKAVKSAGKSASDASGKEDFSDPCIPLVRELAETLSEHSLTTLKMEREGLRIHLSRDAGRVVSAREVPVVSLPESTIGETSAPQGISTDSDESSHPGTVKAPMVGTVYLSPEPGDAVFVKENDSVREGQTLLLIEAMKTFNAISAPRSGKLIRIFVGDSQPVEYGEPLLIIE